MYRDIAKQLLEWKSSQQRKPLLVRGARQIGKSFSITAFGSSSFEGNTHVFNFEKHPELSSIFEQNLDSKRILSELELFVGSHIKQGSDLLFFDEIQECPNAIMSLRYFFEEQPSLHVIAAGSLLEFVLKDISFPVGRIQMISMFPMTYNEFVHALGNNLLTEKLKSGTELPIPILDKANKLLFSYFIVGGMPECVQTFINTNSYIKVGKVQDNLLTTFRQDFSKYAGHSDKRCLNSVLSSVAAKVGEQIKYAQLSADFTNPTIKKAFELLETARLFTKIRKSTANGLPLGAAVSEKKFKTVFLDIGLMARSIGLSAANGIHKKALMSSFNGKLAEQFVGQELLVTRMRELYYWAREAKGSSAEVDYLTIQSHKIVPIEVKSGVAGKLKSMHMLLKSHAHIPYGIVLTEDKFGELAEQKLRFRPLIYTASL